MRYYSVEDLQEVATLEEQKEHLLNMMKAFDAFCKENGLRYYLSGGTLLGAIRHKGFIPWDDDVDVNMPRPDCEKLMELSNGQIGQYYLNPPNYSKEYHAYHYKLCDDSILVGKMVDGEALLKRKIYPIFMDIFPIEGLPDTEEENIAYFEELIKLKERANMLWDKRISTADNIIRRKLNNRRYKDLNEEGIERLFNNVVAYQKSIDFDSADYIGVTSTNVHTTEERVPKADYLSVVEVEFEGYMFPAPKCYHQYLTQLYGSNYMEYPPVHTRISRHGLIPFIAKPYSFREERYSNSITLVDRWCEGKPDITIAICGLIKSENLGELFIARSLEYLIATELRKKYPELQIKFKEVDLLARKDEILNVKGAFNKSVTNYWNFDEKHITEEKLLRRLKRTAKKIESQHLSNIIHRTRHAIWKHGKNYRKRLDAFYEERLEGVDFIVVDGAGLLEYSYNEYEWPLLEISRYAEKHNLSIVYNAIGRAGEFDEKDFRSQILKKALQSDAVKYISARDNPDEVQICVGDKHDVKLLADAAFWMRETYPELGNEKKQLIGIGLIRGNSLTEYGKDFDEMAWVELFAGMAQTLTRKGYDYEFFTNGLPSDIIMGRLVLGSIGLDNSRMRIRPINDIELYKTINQYKGIITCRMHSAIAAFTLQTPSVILSWNDKVEKLMETIGYPERAIRPNDFDPETIVSRLEQAMEEGVDREKVENMKNKALESVSDYIELIEDVVERKLETGECTCNTIQ